MRFRRCYGSMLMVLLSAAGTAVAAQSAGSARYIVEAATSRMARVQVDRVGASVEQDLTVIHGVSAYLNPWQITRLRATPGLRLFEDRALVTDGLLGLLSPVTSPLLTAVDSTSTPKDGTGVLLPTLLYQTNYPMLVGADTLQQAGITGRGVTIAVLDSGLWQDLSQNFGSRLLATRDVLGGNAAKPVTGDPYGHGTHITSIAAAGAMNVAGSYLGISTQANLVIVRAFDRQGAGRYVDVIAALNWIVANQKKYNIRVLNLSFGAPPESYYWDDPINQAVMAAWSGGIVVVASAGNEGPTPMTIDVPGNVPYVITAGALTDNYTPYDVTDDRLASFSSTGPTFEGFVKPAQVGPGVHMVAPMSS